MTLTKADIFQETATPELLMIESWTSRNPRLVAGITTRNGGASSPPFLSLNMGLHVNDDPGLVLQNRERLADVTGMPLSSWVSGEQVHGVNVAKVGRSDRGSGAENQATAIPGSDGLYTMETDVLLTAFYADCVPLFFYAPDHNFLGLAHAGWRGTVSDMAGKMVEAYADKEGLPPEDMYAAIGPAIGSCCYEVDQAVIDAVNSIAPDCPEAVYKNSGRDGHFMLDLKELNRYLLIQAGIAENNITVTDYCTSCSDNLFFSHRRDKGKTGRMLSFIGMKEE